MNSRLDPIQAILMNDVLLPRLDKAIQHRKMIANLYITGIKNKSISIPPSPKYSQSVFHLFPILTKKRDDLKKHLENNMIESGIHYPILITDQKAMKDYPHIVYKDLKNAQRFTRCELSLPINATITRKEAAQVVKILNQWKP
jgi:dTDP-3-amino-3,4,6-trideoxy-alpha-D-glucose transaminase